MGLLAKLFNDASDTEFKLAQDLVAMAIADGEISKAEQKAITEICRKEGISDDILNDCLMGFDENVKALIPDKRKDKAGYLTKLIRVMGVDGVSSHMEIYLLEIIASKMGFSHMELVSLVLMTATRTFFSGDTGSRTLLSFLRNDIDPKGKNLCENCDNIKKIFDLMAENVPQLQNEEEDKAAFVKAMSAATDLLMENSLLCNEFRMMGIDFETVLMNEQELAIRRWMST
jgi:Tellurite resistance protein TerB.